MRIVLRGMLAGDPKVAPTAKEETWRTGERRSVSAVRVDATYATRRLAHSCYKLPIRYFMTCLVLL